MTVKKSLGERIIRASVIVGIAHILLKFAGLIQVKFATHYLDTSIYEPLMVVAFGGIINNLFLIGEEVIGPTFLTVFMHEREQRGEEEAWKFTNTTLTCQALLLLAVVLSIVCFPDFYISLFTSWTPENRPEHYSLLRTSLQILAPCLWFLSLGSTTYVLLNGYKKFFLAAFGDTSTKICIVLGLFVGMGIFGLDYHAALFAMLIGSAAKLLTHLWGLRGNLHRLRPAFSLNSPGMRSMVLLMIPLLAGIIFAKVRDVFNNVYVLSRIDQEGVLMANDLGRKLFASLQWLVPYSLQIALFPFLCELVSKDDRQRLGEVVEKSWRMLVAVFAPMAVMLAVLAHPIAIGIFFGGKTLFDVASLSGLSTGCYVLVLPAAAVECVLMQGFFADRRTVSVTLLGISASLLSVIISYIAVVPMQVGQYGASAVLACVALGFVFSRWLKSLALTYYFRHCTPSFKLKTTVLFLVRVMFLSLLTGFVTWLLSRGIAHFWPDGISEAMAGNSVSINRIAILARLAIAGIGGGAVFFCGAFVLRLQEPIMMVSWIFKRKKKA